MSTEFHRVLFVLLFAGFGSLSAYGFDRLTQTQQESQAEIQRVETQLQRLSRAPSSDLHRLRLLCRLSSAYKQARRPAVSKTLQPSIQRLAKRLQQNGTPKLSSLLLSCTKNTRG